MTLLHGKNKKPEPVMALLFSPFPSRLKIVARSVYLGKVVVEY
jgi:hypothetical protein